MTGPNATLVALRAPSPEAGASFHFRRNRSPIEQRKSLLFLKKKKQKDFFRLMRRGRKLPHQTNESFLVLFFKKEPLA